MNEALALLQTFFREAWTALAGILLAFVLLAALAQVLRVSSGAVIGANLWVWEGVTGIAGVVLLALFAFLGVPQIVKAALVSLPSGKGCGPIGELGTFSAGLIGGLAALRMLKTIFISTVSAAIGSGAGMSQALGETAEALFGMLLAALAVPLAARFLGVC
ncbi:MAG: hypothetical protein WCK35_27805 [Chloroflexota bacterium]